MKNFLFHQCTHFQKCSGCSEILNDNPPKIWQEVSNFLTPFCEPALHQGNPIHWRFRAKVAVRGTSLHPLIGLFRKNSHEVIPIPNCMVHHPQLNKAFAIIQKALFNMKLEPYNEKTGQGDLRYLQGVVERKSQRVQLTFILNFSQNDTRKMNAWEHVIQKIGEEHCDLWHSLWINFNPKKTNTIFGDQWMKISGEGLLWEQFEDIAICYGPASFGQANLNLFEKMLIQIRNLIPADSKLVEFYAGVGAIGLFISNKCASVQCCEINPFAEEFFNHSRERLPKHVKQKIHFSTVATQQSLSLLKNATTVIVDPPRKGLENSFFDTLIKTHSIKQFIYVSCGWDSFQRDFKRLLNDGWAIKNVDGYVFFPGSNHIELLANFEREVTAPKSNQGVPPCAF